MRFLAICAYCCLLLQAVMIVAGLVHDAQNYRNDVDILVMLIGAFLVQGYFIWRSDFSNVGARNAETVLDNDESLDRTEKRVHWTVWVAGGISAVALLVSLIGLTSIIDHVVHRIINAQTIRTVLGSCVLLATYGAAWPAMVYYILKLVRYRRMITRTRTL